MGILGRLLSPVFGSFDRSENAPYKDVDEQGRIGGLVDTSQQFGNQAQDMYTGTGQRMNNLADMLQNQAMGRDSLSQEQLRQNMQRGLAQQQALAAGARPGNAAMAARQASMNAANMSSGLAGQQAMAGIAERQAAQQALGGLLGGMRGQDLQALLGSRGQAFGGLGDIERAKTARYTGALSQPTEGEQLMGAATGLMGGWLGGRGG